MNPAARLSPAAVAARSCRSAFTWPNNSRMGTAAYSGGQADSADEKPGWLLNRKPGRDESIPALPGVVISHHLPRLPVMYYEHTIE
jgi:hypothetical protein